MASKLDLLQVRLLPTRPGANESGDLFTRASTDVLFALGYEVTHQNLAKPGHEIDLIARHRTESRLALAECKATKDKVGGDTVNKFVGILDAERRKGVDVVGYMISLNGFTGSARSQEEDFHPPRVVLMDGASMADELVNGRILCTSEHAAAVAAACGSESVPKGSQVSVTELLFHELGWVWACRYRIKHVETHVCLIHADGYALSRDLAQRVLDADAEHGERISNLRCVAGDDYSASRTEFLTEIRLRYFSYLAADFGEIELAGLPADQEAGLR